MATYQNELSELVYELNSSTSTTKLERSASLDSLLILAADQRASDILLVLGSPVILRIRGELNLGTGKILSSDDLRRMLLPLLSAAQLKELEDNRAVDFCFAHNSAGRFRANVHYQRGTLAASIRLLPAQIPTIESLHLPPVLSRLMERRQGLVLLTGPTGCGKTSTMAAFVDFINARRREHIVTIEDPVEYQHTNKKSILEQIEVGYDTPSFAQAVRAVLRQNPNVILIGEMRDSETMAAALTAAETGHLVLSSLHTNDASQTMSRIVDSFPASNQSQIRQQLSLALLAVIAQQLVPGLDQAGLYPAVEIMVATLAVKNLVRHGHDHLLRSQISTGKAEGMMTMDQSLAELVQSRRISRDTALAHCYHPDELRSYLP
ncbi:twitching motility protein PilT [Granulicella aggregans]|uniref:Twitching motility protein PilT n=1 Tax=Granulicella aggregans TaxID=474949 RepID=A0A7W7ZBY1_9BACT|nr:PilT/PilU family type 4a pilus ATPase [Granulicella aggregans]MBB5057075.1 twitching motility protein PilT [Granulicella aggregans]